MILYFLFKIFSYMNNHFFYLVNYVPWLSLSYLWNELTGAKCTQKKAIKNIHVKENKFIKYITKSVLSVEIQYIK